MTGLDFTGKRILVTGGAGFIGSNLTARLVRSGGDVIVLDDLFTGELANIDPDIQYEFVEGSVADDDLVCKLVARVDMIAHLAARNIIVSTKNPRSDYAVNIGGTLNLLLAARDSKIERMVYTSSASVYGNPRIIPITEDERPHTFSPYAVSKLAGENYCHAFYETYDTPVCSVRYSNVYGPNQNPKNPYGGVIAKFMEAISNDEAPRLHGDGEQTRDFTYVDDAVEATLLALSSAKAEGSVFNLGTGTETKVIELVRILCRLMEKDIVPEHLD
ncbi:MAG: NAD-dependent epimerase/dehydratase family protein, partial [candidate division Zixibacteria bacterium]